MTTHRCEENLVAPVALAHEFDIRPQLIYGWIKKGRLQTWGSQPKLICRIHAANWYGIPLDATPEAADPGELLASPILAFRVWTVNFDDHEGLQLQSFNKGEGWPIEGPLHAVCRVQKRGRYPHAVPLKRCTCGIYALESPRDKDMPQYTYMQARWLTILGAVEMWGKYIKGTKGWRTQFARPAALLCNPPEQADEKTFFAYVDIVHALADLYDVPLTHSVKMLGEVNWIEHRGDREGRRGDASAGEAAYTSGTAYHRALEGTSSFSGIAALYQEGMLSLGDIRRLLE